MVERAYTVRSLRIHGGAPTAPPVHPPSSRTRSATRPHPSVSACSSSGRRALLAGAEVEPRGQAAVGGERRPEHRRRGRGEEKERGTGDLVGTRDPADGLAGLSCREELRGVGRGGEVPLEQPGP